MSDANALDAAALGPYLEQHVPGFAGLEAIEKFGAGQSNPTYLIKAHSGRYVLRAKPPGQLLKSAHQVDREFRVMKALAGSGVPVPNVLYLSGEDTPIGRMFYVMAFLDGRIFWDPALPEILDNARRAAIYDAMNATLAALHGIDVARVGLSDFGKPGNYFERQLGRWTSQYRASTTPTPALWATSPPNDGGEERRNLAALPLPPEGGEVARRAGVGEGISIAPSHREPGTATPTTGAVADMDRLIAWLADNMPADDGQLSLVHGDYRLDNMIFAKDAPSVIAVLDWELSTLGHPFADLAYQCMQWRLPHASGFRSSRGLGGVDRAALGLPSERDYVERYCERRGIDRVGNWTFYLAFSFFRFAAICQGVYRRALDGNASNPEKAQLYGDVVKSLAGLAVELIDQEG